MIKKHKAVVLKDPTHSPVVMHVMDAYTPTESVTRYVLAYKGKYICVALESEIREATVQEELWGTRIDHYLDRPKVIGN